MRNPGKYRLDLESKRRPGELREDIVRAQEFRLRVRRMLEERGEDSVVYNNDSKKRCRFLRKKLGWDAVSCVEFEKGEFGDVNVIVHGESGGELSKISLEDRLVGEDRLIGSFAKKLSRLFQLALEGDGAEPGMGDVGH
jgi:hypothetical protein